MTRREELEAKFNRPAFQEKENWKKIQEEYWREAVRLEQERQAQELEYQLSFNKWLRLTKDWSEEDRDWAWNFIQGHSGIAFA